MANKIGYSVMPNVLGWLGSPRSQYIPLSDVQFSGASVVMPGALPPTSAQFPNAQSNKILNIPSVQAAYSTGRTGRIF